MIALSRAFRYAGSAAALMLIPLSVLSAYALGLRVSQYGWSVDRIALAACVLVALAYAGGYAVAVFRRGRWLQFIEASNFAVALFGLAVLFSYFSPIADPARISVASQMARLETGKATTRQFDYQFLRWEGGRFGEAALERLKTWTGNDAHYVRDQARAALNAKSRVWIGGGKPDLAATVTVYPSGKKLPSNFTANAWDRLRADASMPACLNFATSRCDAFLLDLDGDGRDEILIVEKNGASNAIFEQQQGAWRVAGALGSNLRCAPVLEALKSGRFELVLPPVKSFRDILAGGMRLSVDPADDNSCP